MMFNNFSQYCENKTLNNGLLSVLKLGADRGFTTNKFVKEILESSYAEDWDTLEEFVSILNTKVYLLEETTADQVRRLSPELKETRYGNIIRATKASFEKLLDKLHYKAAIDMDATGNDIESVKKRQIINNLYKILNKTVADFDPVFKELNPEDKERLRGEVSKLQDEFEKGIMPYINQFLRTNINPKYDSYDVVLAKIEGSKELGIRKLGGAAKDALARSIYAILKKEGIEPVYKRKIELLARAIGAEPPSLEEKKTEKQERETRLSAEAETRKAEAAKRAAEMDDARAKGNLRFNPDLDKALGIE